MFFCEFLKRIQNATNSTIMTYVLQFSNLNLLFFFAMIYYDLGKLKIEQIVAQLSKLEFMTTTSQNQDRILGSSKSDKVKIAVWGKKLLGHTDQLKLKNY